MQTLIIYESGLNQNYYAFTLILRLNFVWCSKLPSTKFIDYTCFEIGLEVTERELVVGPALGPVRPTPSEPRPSVTSNPSRSRPQ